MLLWTLQISIISIIMIFLVHHLLIFFKTTLTVPKIKDLVNVPQKKYQDIYNILSKDTSSGFNPINDVKQETKIEISSMKNELKSFLKKQLNNGNNNGLTNNSGNGSTSIETLDAFSGSGNNSGFGSVSGSNMNFSAY